MKKKKGNLNSTTQYGEFVGSFDNFLSPSKQKERAEELEKSTKNEKK